MHLLTFNNCLPVKRYFDVEKATSPNTLHTVNIKSILQRITEYQ